MRTGRDVHEASAPATPSVIGNALAIGPDRHPLRLRCSKTWSPAPIAEKLGPAQRRRKQFAKEIVLQGVLSIQAGNNPRVVEMQLMSFLSLKEQAGLAKAA